MLSGYNFTGIPTPVTEEFSALRSQASTVMNLVIFVVLVLVPFTLIFIYILNMPVLLGLIYSLTLISDVFGLSVRVKLPFLSFPKKFVGIA